MKTRADVSYNSLWQQMKGKGANHWWAVFILLNLPFLSIFFLRFGIEQYQQIERLDHPALAAFPVFLVCWLTVTSLVSVWAALSFTRADYQFVWVALFLYGFFFYVFANISDRALAITKYDRTNHFFLVYLLFLAGRNFFWKEKKEA